MSILSFLDTVYDTVQHSQRYGGPSELFKNADIYKYNTLRYPLDVGSADKGHYMLIHINTQKKTQFLTNTTSQDPTVIANMRDIINRRGDTNFGGAFSTGISAASNLSQQVGSELSYLNKKVLENQYAGPTVGALQSAFTEGINKIKGTDVGAAFTSAADSIQGAANSINGVNFLRTIQRSTDSIALYMPDTLNFEYRQSYNELSLSKGILGGASAAGQSIADSYDKLGAAGVGTNLSPFIASYVASRGNFGDFGKALIAGGFGVVENPMIEMLYSQPNLRSFQFDFMFYPRDEKEAIEVQNILNRLRFHQAPEIKAYSGGYFLIPPSEFDIQFYYNGKINPNIDKISTCVLENIIVNYAPTGFTAYESLNETSPTLGRTGMPVAIQMTLMFKETQIMTKEMYSNKDTILNSTMTKTP